MTIREEKRDLFAVPQGYYLAHCITGDCTLAAGVAKTVDEVYNMKEKLIDRYNDGTNYSLENHVGMALLVDNVFNLVLKRRIDKKSKYKKLKNCLEDMKCIMEQEWITKLAIPKLACGHEGLEWDKVKEIIEEVFEDTDVEILVCSL